MLHRPLPVLLGLTVLTAAALPLAAQHPDAAPPSGAVAVAVTQNAGLERVGGTGDLRGGGTDYRVRFTAAGMRFEPALGRAVATTQHLALAPVAVRRGTTPVCEPAPNRVPVARDLAAVYEHAPAVHERFDVHAGGVDVSWHFAEPIVGDGDLVVRYAVDTSLPAPRADRGGLAFELPDVGGVHVGGVTGVDAGGARCTGSTRWVDGQLELALPAAFVATARYPLVLDPTIGAILTVNSEIYDDSDPDVAYDLLDDCWLAVWVRTFSGTNSDVRGQRIAGNGALLGNVIFFNSDGVAERPRVASLRSRHRFGVVWAQQDSGTNSVLFEAVAGSGGITHSHTVASSTTTLYHDADIGCETEATIGQSRDFVVAFQAGSSIQVRRVWFDVADAVADGSLTTILQSVPLSATYSQPAIARTAGSDGFLLVVARRTSVGNADQIVAVAVRTFSFLIGSNPSATIATASGETFDQPDVDGYAGRWIVAWHRSGGSANAVTRVPVVLDGGLVVGSPVTQSGPPGSTVSAPSVGYGLGKSWLGYRSTALLGSASLTARGIDTTTCVAGTDSFAETVTGSENRIVVATHVSGGLPTTDVALAVWAEATNVYAQRLVNHANGGVTQDLGGGCGSNRGTQSFLPNPAIGCSNFVCALTNVQPSTITIFNLSTPAAPIACGACQWVPFSVTLTRDTGVGVTNVGFPIPYQQALVGAQFDTQWTTLHPSQAPCSLVPGLVLSNRSRLTIGQ